MKILIIEDDQHKSAQIFSFLQKNFETMDVYLKKSYQSGLKEVFFHKYDYVLLDMQLPTFDIKPGEDGYKFRKLAGMDILNEIKRKRIDTRVIVITQFETFGEGENYIDLENLKDILEESYKDYYIDTIYYSPESINWQKNLLKFLKV